MSEPFHLKIYAADKAFYDADAVSVTIPVTDGGMHPTDAELLAPNGYYVFLILNYRDQRFLVVPRCFL